MKKYILISFLFCLMPLWGTTLPDHPFFNAMNDEMQRTVQQLHMKGSPRPYYVVYRLDEKDSPVSVEAVLGEITLVRYQKPTTTANALVAVGNSKQDSFGVDKSMWGWYRNVGDSYRAIRHGFWDITNASYLRASRWYEDKQAYLRKKNIKSSLPDFVAGKQETYMDPELAPLPKDPTEWVELAKHLSAKGKAYPFIEQFYLLVRPFQYKRFWMNNLGAYAYTNQNYVLVDLDVSWRTKSGFEKSLNYSRYMSMEEGWQQTVEKELDALLEQLRKTYDAKKGEAYIGPVLLTAPAAARLWQMAFVKNMEEFGTLISAEGEEINGGSFKDKLGLRVVSPIIDVYDKPLLRTYDHKMLGDFYPLDDEGMRPQELTLVKDGFLRDIPTSSRPFKEGVKSNGHGFAYQGFPREYLTNVVVEPHEPLSQAALEQKLIEMCREQELEYGYILHSLEGSDDGILLAERIYVSDGRKEPIYGLKIETAIGPGLLRDIRGAGDEKAVFYKDNNQAILSPALLLEEMELVPTNKKPARKPFVPKP